MIETIFIDIADMKFELHNGGKVLVTIWIFLVLADGKIVNLKANFMNIYYTQHS